MGVRGARARPRQAPLPAAGAAQGEWGGAGRRIRRGRPLAVNRMNWGVTLGSRPPGGSVLGHMQFSWPSLHSQLYQEGKRPAGRRRRRVGSGGKRVVARGCLQAVEHT